MISVKRQMKKTTGLYGDDTSPEFEADDDD
jgi:hypothetical protein